MFTNSLTLLPWRVESNSLPLEYGLALVTLVTGMLMGVMLYDF